MANGYSIRAKAGDAAEIMIYDDVGDGFFGGVSAKQFADDLKALGRVSKIDLRLNSFGGDVFDGLAIYRQLVDHPARITAHIDGIAASIASVIAMAGNEIRISESGRVMIHNASGMAAGTSATMRDMAAILDTISASIADVYAARTGRKLPDIRDWMDKESWFDAPRAIELGFATTMAPNMRLAAKFDPFKHKFMNAPSDLLGRPNLEAASEKIARMKAYQHLRGGKVHCA